MIAIDRDQSPQPLSHQDRAGGIKLKQDEGRRGHLTIEFQKRPVATIGVNWLPNGLAHNKDRNLRMAHNTSGIRT